MTGPELEQLAAWCHDTWRRWAAPWLSPTPDEFGQLHASVSTAYEDLPESEKEFRRREARRLLEMVMPLCEQARAAGAERADAFWREKVRSLKADADAAVKLLQPIADAAGSPEFVEGYSKAMSEVFQAFVEVFQAVGCPLR